MVNENFSDYCSSFLKDPNLGSNTFFLDKHNSCYTYKQLIQSAFNRAHYFKNSPVDFFALKFESPYNLFTCLLGAILAEKKVVILSAKEPAASIQSIKDNLSFSMILTDQDDEAATINNSLFLDEISHERAAFYIMSSGSSGPPKGIPLSLDNVYSSAKSLIDFFEMNLSDTSYLNLPHHHIGGLMILWRAFFSMGKVTINESDDYQFISLVPLQLQRMLLINEKTNKLSTCRGVLIGGATLEEHLLKEAKRLKISVFETYGMSETCSLVMINGRPLPEQIVKLDSEGHFLIKGKTISKGVPVDNLGFYHTKDVGVLNNDGTYSFKHRSDLLFKSAGELINPQELEKKALELDWIEMAIVVPIKHPVWTQAAVMVYKTSDATKNEADLIDYLKKHFHPHLVPNFFIPISSDIIQEGLKPRRFEISKFAQEHYFHNLFYYHYIPHTTSKRLMVFFHGFMEDHSDLMPLMENLPETSFLFIDLPGHGKSRASNFKDRSTFFLELISFINFYKAANSLLFYGYSMGGRVALELSLSSLSPELLILESAHFGLSSETDKADRLKSDRALLTKENLQLTSFFQDWYKNPIFGNYNKSSYFLDDVEKKISHDPKEWQASLEFFSPGVFPFDLKTVIEKLSKQKIVGIVGSMDHKYFAHYQEMGLKLSGFSLYEIDNCGHNPHKTHPEEIKKILRMIT